MAKRSIVQFGPTLMAAWQRAVEDPASFSILCGEGDDGRRKAVALRYQMYMLRTAMKNEQHPLFHSAIRVTLRSPVRGNKHYIEADMGGGELDDLLTNAGIGVPDAPNIEE